jgi:hypothetical protein
MHLLGSVSLGNNVPDYRDNCVLHFTKFALSTSENSSLELIVCTVLVSQGKK